ncbi:hypothetical protein K474DRAFT_1602516 [Panus rudis PR-1116 ss-1]|nr:hypothetical protein K474DRAFT_1602516 [Panus rudis PR-1116 ss-1]
MIWDSSDDEDFWNDILGPDWRATGPCIPRSLGFSTGSYLRIPSIFQSSESGSATPSGSSGFGDVEDFDEADSVQSDDSEVQYMEPSLSSRLIRDYIGNLYKHRYQVPRNPLPRSTPSMHHVLAVLKHERPDHFRRELRVTPLTFDKLVCDIINDSIFHNDSPNGQMPVEHQLAITLYRFGHYGNAAGIKYVASWAGVGAGTVVLCTKRVMTAILRPAFKNQVVRMPTAAEKKKAKDWVEQHSCRAWRHGWCLVDGTLVPLSTRPYWFGESYFDRKCNYSLNIQVISLPDLTIIDYGYGFPGSTHDSTAWVKTRMAEQHADILEDGEWVWADSAYPVSSCLRVILVKCLTNVPVSSRRG